ncbi:MAG: SDR family oxidoreductase [Planctomycetaceae bacterium]
MKTFRDKQGLVTGAASGIGRELTLALAREGMRLFLVDVDAAGLDSIVSEVRELGVEAIPCCADLTLRDEIHRLAETVLASWGGVDLLINNAGIAYYGPTQGMTEAQWDRLMNLNLMAPIHLTRLLLPAILEREDPHIVNMCSISGLVAGGRFNAYHTSKFGLVGFTEALRAEYGRKGVGVTAICPGPSKTNLYKSCETSGTREAPQPPAWVCATPERIATVTLKAIRRNRRMQLVTPMAHMLYQMKRFTPWLLDLMNTFSRTRLPWYLGGKTRPRPHSSTVPTLPSTEASMVSPDELTGNKATSSQQDLSKVA